ncbi:hypothetical protein FC82_GL000119 [Secundilactobacillus collinoides DSM 20515 = JCM 1123]|uniref:Uncharacterized protein n=2 Tax=Secundilactobacillus collinoides TaxID=33960 RepID=A0A0R2BD71_SECCO|nr:hypothetical protein FC82_GL000119 [Secundilactobacillus collinoides DSM 20515 = JCM 1123]
MLFIAVAIVCGICTVIFYRRENSERWEAYLFGVMSGSSFLLACLQVGMRIVEKILG